MPAFWTGAGVGHKWVDQERRRFATSYGLSYTDREEEEPDPEKDRRLPAPVSVGREEI